MDLEVKPLRCFAAVVDEASFTKAAERLHITQPNLSMRVRELERYLGFRLFQRTTRQVELTAEGADFLPDARRMIGESDRIKKVAERVRHGQSRHIRVGAALYTIDIPERIAIVEKFIAENPDTVLDIDNRNQTELLADLETGLIDFALLVGIAISRPEFDELSHAKVVAEILYPSDLPRIVLRREQVGLLIPAESPLAMHAMIPRRLLIGEKIAMLAPSHGPHIVRAIGGVLEDAGAFLVFPPEGNGIAVERYGRQFRIPAVTLGWFAEHAPATANMVRRPIEGLDFLTEFVLLRRPQPMSPQALALWQGAQNIAI